MENRRDRLSLSSDLRDLQSADVLRPARAIIRVRQRRLQRSADLVPRNRLRTGHLVGCFNLDKTAKVEDTAGDVFECRIWFCHNVTT